MIPDHEDYGLEIKLVKKGKDVALVFQFEREGDAVHLAHLLEHQLRTGVLYISLTGQPKGDDYGA